MEMTREEARNAVIQHYMETHHFTRKQAEDYIHDDDRVFWLWEEVQKEIEISKRYRWEKFTECGLTLNRAIPIEDEPVGSC